MKLDFRRWLVEAKAPLGPPEIVGFQNSTYVNGEYEQSEMFPTYHAALQARRDQFDKLNRMATTWAVFKDGTRRTMGDAAWFRKRNGDTVNDSRVTRSGRGATLHAYRAKDDRNYQFLAALSILERELRPDGMPRQSGHELPADFWQQVHYALEQSAIHMDGTYLAVLNDYIMDNYDTSHVAVRCVLAILRRGLERMGHSLPDEPEPPTPEQPE